MRNWRVYFRPETGEAYCIGSVSASSEREAILAGFDIADDKDLDATRRTLFVASNEGVSP